MTNREAITTIYADLALALKNSNPILLSLDTAISQHQVGKIKTILLSIRDSILSGSSMSQAFNGQPGISSIELHLIKSVENSSHLSEVLFALAQFRNIISEFYRMSIISTIYPVFVFLVSVGVVITLGSIASPLLDATNTNSQSHNLFIVFIEEYLAWIALLLFLIPLLMIICMSCNPRWKPKLLDIMLYLPIVGACYKDLLSARYLTFLSLLVEKNVVIHTALKIAGSTVTPPSLKKYFIQLEQGINQGLPVSTLLLKILQRANFIHISLVHGMAWGFYTNSLPHALSIASSQSRLQLSNRFKLLSEMIAPIVLLFSGLMVLAIAYSLFIPLATLDLKT